MRQSDLANETGVERKTISSITRGFHTTTRVLEKVAIAFQVSLDDILISPARREANEERKRLLREAFEDTWRRYEDPGPLALPAKSSEAGLTDKHLNLEIQERKEKHRKAEEQARRKARYQGKAPKQRRFPHLK